MADLFAGQPISLEQMIGCARREAAMRKSVYPRWVAAAKMTEEKARLEIDTMDAVVIFLEGVLDAGHGGPLQILERLRRG